MAQVLLFTDRPEFEAELRAACAKVDLELQSHAPELVAELSAGAVGAVFDGAAAAFDEDELLASVGLLRALGAQTAVVLAEPERHASITDLLYELCGGAVSRGNADLDRLAASLSRRCEAGREGRFEYLSVSPRGSELLAVLGDARSLVLSRPLAGNDDGSEVSAIHLAPDARSAEVELASGVRVALSSAGILPSTGASPESLGVSDIDGATLGKRLRELRLAAGLTQAELARRTGIHRPNIARVEAGRHTPSLETLARLAQAIGVSTTRVLSG